jgi:predicted anti-sigma-YlaC factor YlaD
MTCDEVRDRLDRYAAGRLAGPAGAALGRHLEACAECRADAEAARALAPGVAALPRTLAPPRDLWAGIAPRLRPRVGPGRVVLPVWALAAAALLLVAGTWTLTRRLAPPPAAVATMPAGVVEAERRYGETAAELAAAYAGARERMDPATRALVERNLATVERALAETRAALALDPRNASLATLVHAAWRRKLDFLEHAAALDREG